jgi:outer membrane protein
MEQSVLLAAATIYMDISRDSANLEVQQNNVRVLQRTLTAPAIGLPPAK